MYLAPNVERLKRLRLVGYALKEQIAFCPTCDFQYEPKTMGKNECPTCRCDLHVTTMNMELIELVSRGIPTRQQRVQRDEQRKEFISEMMARRESHATWNRNLEDFIKAYWMSTRASGADADELDKDQRYIWDFAAKAGWIETLRALADAWDSYEFQKKVGF